MIHAWRLSFGMPLPFSSLSLSKGATAHATSERDFSAVTTRATANRLAREGRLVKTSLFPTELGGSLGSHNIIFLPFEAIIDREILVRTLHHFLQDDFIDSLEVLPEYHGKSIVPTRICFIARHNRENAPYERVIEVWR